MTFRTPFPPLPDTRISRLAPPLPPSQLPATPVHIDPIPEDLEHYSVVVFDSRDLPDGAGVFSEPRPFRVPYSVAGDHFYVAELRGGRPLYVRLGKQNPLVRLQEGLLLTRYFRSWSIEGTLLDTAFALVGGTTRAVFYVSHGPLVSLRPDRGYGLNQPMFGAGTANTAWARLFPGAFARTLGKQRGGSVLIENTDLINTLQVSWDLVGGAVSAVFPVEAGRSITLPFDSTMEENSIGFGLVVGCISGTCTFSFILSDGVFGIDRNDAEQPKFTGIQ